MTASTMDVNTSSSSFENVTYKKVALHFMPLLMICYIIAYLDRVNVGFAKLQMLNDLGFSEAVYGLGAGIFFLGYFLFEVPSNIILHKVGARIWIARIMVTWAIISGACMFITTPTSFYVLRFLLGLAEAGFFPGIILYLTYWFPSSRRSRMVSIFMSAIPLAGLIGGPLSGWVMESLAGINGLKGWQWMFLIEALPAVILAVIVFLYLDDGIQKAKWLSAEEKDLLAKNIEIDQQTKVDHGSFVGILKDGRLWLAIVVYFCIVMGQYGLTFFLPSLIKAAGIKGVLNIGLFSAIPYGCAVIAMIWFGLRSDRKRERRWHLIIPMLLGAIGLTGSALAGTTNTEIAVAFLTLAAIGVLSATPLFWALPTSILAGASAAAGIAVINSFGNIAGFMSPFLIGAIKDATGSSNIGLYLISGILVIGSLVVLRFPAKVVNR
jgi:D-galactonate transporter